VSFNVDRFPGFNAQINKNAWSETVQIPERIYSLDGKRFVAVSLDRMCVPSDEHGQWEIRLKEKLATFTPMTCLTASYVLLESLNGKRKTSTVRRWLDELSLFSRTVSEAMDGQRISVITLKMYQWYCSSKNASQQKLLRSVLLRWIDEETPGVHPELVNHLKTTAAPKPRGMIEVQNAVPAERPFSMSQVRTLIDNIEQLYVSGDFDAQTRLLWRMMISEALRPTQMSLLQVGDVKVERDVDGKLVAVHLNVPMVKQSGVAARDYQQSHRLSPAVSQALVEHLEFANAVHGSELPKTWPLFCVRLSGDRKTPTTKRTSVGIHHVIQGSRKKIASLNDDFDSTDLFNRRFKHTKLTHLAASGAPLDVLAYAGFQTSTISLTRYVNLTEEAFVAFEKRLEPAYQQIEAAFRGKLIERNEATHADPEHRIADPSMEDDVGACGADPCEVLACFGCYTCPRFEAFTDGPHERVAATLLAEQARGLASGMPAETLLLREHILSAVRRVIQLIED
jgi:hypothetical protein